MSYPGRIPGRVRLGMSVPLADFAKRLAETGPVYAQRIFCTSLDDDETATARIAQAEGRLPVVSFKPGSWTDVAAGKSDKAINTALDRLAATGKPVVVAFHHEPSGDGTGADWVAMQRHVAPLVHARPNLAFAIIGNGFWWGAGNQAGNLADYLPKTVLAVADVVCGDFYESDRNQVADLLTAFLTWADKNGVTELGVGELGTYTADGLVAATRVLLSHPDRFGFACYFNSPRNSRANWVLSGARLDAFRAALAASVPAPDPVPEPTPPPVDPLQQQIDDLTAQIRALGDQLTQAKADTAAATQRADAAEARAQDAETKAATAATQLATATSTITATKDALTRLAATL